MVSNENCQQTAPKLQTVLVGGKGATCGHFLGFFSEFSRSLCSQQFDFSTLRRRQSRGQIIRWLKRKICCMMTAVALVTGTSISAQLSEPITVQ